jgi:SAM-dependent methyltransferase
LNRRTPKYPTFSVDWNQRPIGIPFEKSVNTAVNRFCEHLLVHQELVNYLCCPYCRGPLALETESLRHVTGHIDRGQLRCSGCVVSFPIERGIPRFVPTEGYVASFGRQWTRYAVEQLEEDEQTFEVKTGFRLSDLSGQTLLDAGCGGGRYSFVAARHGARVIAVDMSRAIDRAAHMCREFDHVDFLQADLLQLPLVDQVVDLSFSMGVLHHSSDPSMSFRRVAAAVRSGGRLAVWLYRQNTTGQERLNDVLRGITTRMTTAQLEAFAVVGAMLGSIPIINRTLNKLINFSSHPVWANRLCDTFDWYSPQFQSHHTIAELEQWFQNAGFADLKELSPAKPGHFYRWAYEHDLIIGSGVNMVGTRTANAAFASEVAHYTSTLESIVRRPGTSTNQA